MQVVILDTEYTSWEGSLQRGWSGPNEHREIVQIAAIIVDVSTLGEMDHFSILTKPKINQTLSSYFINLTGISNEMLKEGKVFLEGLKPINILLEIDQSMLVEMKEMLLLKTCA